MSDPLLLTREFTEALCARVDESPLAACDKTALKSCVRHCFELGEAYNQKSHTVKKLLRMIFGPKTEKAHTVMASLAKPTKEKSPCRGHGKNGASSYAGQHVFVPHPTLKKGDHCPECEKGKIYPTEPGVAVRITGAAPLQATSFEREKLRCNLCGKIFSSKPEGQEKYDASATAMVALMRYGTGVPFARLEQLQHGFGVPLPASTQWDIVEKAAKPAHPVYRELVNQAAQGETVHVDDTTMKVLQDAEGERKGTFTTGILSLAGTRKIALFFTGHKHAGENMADLLAKRQQGLAPPIQMCDALSRNTSNDFLVILANCLTHGRRNFIDVAESFPEECRHMIDTLARVYKHDADTKAMTPEERLIHHQTESGPLMDELKTWMETQFEEREVEPNSGLGKAFTYMLKHWVPLTLFLRVPGAPLDNTAVERCLKMAIRHRRNSLYFRTLHGAYIGDIFMSIIQTCRLSKINPFDYLVALQKHSHDVFKNPTAWLPWNYEAAMAALSRPP